MQRVRTKHAYMSEEIIGVTKEQKYKHIITNFKLPGKARLIPCFSGFPQAFHAFTGNHSPQLVISLNRETHCQVTEPNMRFNPEAKWFGLYRKKKNYPNGVGYPTPFLSTVISLNRENPEAIGNFLLDILKILPIGNFLPFKIRDASMDIRIYL